MSARTAGRFMATMCVSAFLVACADLTGISQLADEMQSSLRSESLSERCARWESTSFRSNDCLAWKRQRDAVEEARRQSDAAAARKAAQDAQRAILIEQQEQREREAQQREIAAMQADERDGYKRLTFEDFALDASKMLGSKITLHGIYVDKGKRLASNQLAALMWIEGARSTQGALIPLVTENAVRDARALLLRCAKSPIGCAIVVRGRVRTLTMRNTFGAESKELGVVVESVR